MYDAHMFQRDRSISPKMILDSIVNLTNCFLNFSFNSPMNKLRHLNFNAGEPGYLWSAFAI